MQLTIIVGFRNRELERAQRSLDSLNEQTDKTFDVVLVDYGSDLQTRQEMNALAGKYSFCQYIYNDTRGRPWNRAHALNTGIRLAKGDFIFTADIDLIYHADFIKTAKQVGALDKAVFFTVAYLPKNFVFGKSLEAGNKTLSKSYALGLGLIPKSVLAEIRGYDEFYCFWGQEDNDIEQRLKNKGLVTVFYTSPILLFHQWHSRTIENKLDYPQNWGMLQKDYLIFYANQVVRNEMREWGQCFHAENRLALKALNNESTIYLQFDEGKDFMQFFLQQWLMKAKEMDVLAIEWANPDLKSFHAAKSTRLANSVQKSFEALKLPFAISNRYTSLYTTPDEVRDMVARFIVANHSNIGDYAWVNTGEHVKLVIVR